MYVRANRCGPSVRSTVPVACSAGDLGLFHDAASCSCCCPAPSWQRRQPPPRVMQMLRLVDAVGARHAHSIEDETWDRGTAGLSHTGMRRHQRSSFPFQSEPPAPPREDATRTSGRESAARARHAGGPHAGRGPHARRHGGGRGPPGRAEGGGGGGPSLSSGRRHAWLSTWPSLSSGRAARGARRRRRRALNEDADGMAGAAAPDARGLPFLG